MSCDLRLSRGCVPMPPNLAPTLRYQRVAQAPSQDLLMTDRRQRALALHPVVVKPEEAQKDAAVARALEISAEEEKLWWSSGLDLVI